MPRHIACLTSDFDAVSGFIARCARTPTPLSRGEFGVVASERILALLRRHDVRTTWFIPGHTIESFPEARERIVAAGHEIGHHGWTHVSPVSMSREREVAELLRGQQAIRRLCGEDAVGCRSPAWDLSPHSVDQLLAHGFLYDSSMMGYDCSP
ncbi:MAG: polysaccharide deacetylase, partial [Alphaproteobacteria bacterium]|nr:polysaccharide deacetylase [Alphaproteobacteria bacterium]